LRNFSNINNELANKFEQGGVLSNIGVIYKDLNNYNKAIIYLLQALELKRGMNDKYGEGNDLNNIGNIYSLLGQDKTSLA